MVKGKTAKSKKSEREGSDYLLPRPSECVRIRSVEIKDNSDKDQLFRALRGKGRRIGKLVCRIALSGRCRASYFKIFTCNMKYSYIMYIDRGMTF